MNRWDLLPYPALGQAHNASEDSWTFDFYASTYYDRRVKFTKDNKHTTRVSYNLYWANDIYEVTEIPAHTPYSSYRFTHAHPDWMIADDVARVWGRNLGNNSMFEPGRFSWRPRFQVSPGRGCIEDGPTEEVPDRVA